MTSEKKLEIFNAIIALGDIWGKEDKVEMLNRIWNLRLLSSEDPRYNDAYGDAVKHLRDNDDWDDEYVFLTRFGLLKANDEVFFKFLNEVVSTKVRSTKDEILQYVETVNDLLRNEQLGYVLKGEEYGLPVYEIQNQAIEESRPTDIRENHVPFVVDQAPTTYPSFVLSSITWDDYSRKTTFNLAYVKAKGSLMVNIGKVKIMHSDELVTLDVMPKEFTELPYNYCSVGQDETYYRNIRRMFPNSYKSLMYALRDAAYFSTIADRYQHTISFQKSLLRANNAERAFRNAHSILEGIDLTKRYNFTLLGHIPYYEGTVPVTFNFGDLDAQGNLDRIKALIGENGSGKSSILYSLAKALHDEGGKLFKDGHRPDFSKVIAISYSIFDNLFNLTKNSSFNFIYCGLRSRNNELLSEKDKENRLKLSLNEIEYKGRVHAYHETLVEVIDSSMLAGIFPTGDKIDKTQFLANIKKMSSGQAMITSIVTELFAHIRDNSLILFDEPEVHLHANAITRLMRILFEICNEFNSACIVATHSAVILQELLARNVMVVEQDVDTQEPYVRGMNTETLGENLTTITEDIFGRANIDKHYGEVIQRLIRKGKKGEDIEQTLKTDGLPMSLNLYMYMRRQLERAQADD